MNKTLVYPRVPIALHASPAMHYTSVQAQKNPHLQASLDYLAKHTPSHDFPYISIIYLKPTANHMFMDGQYFPLDLE